MLELWRPPQGAGEPIGCLATTYTFAPELFDEQCLARFLEIDSEPNREDLAFLLERESRLGGVYAGVLVDFTQSGVAHSLRWDVLPVRVRSGKQHAKLSLLVWRHHVRVIVASANLTSCGYRLNQEVATSLEFSPKACDRQLLDDAVGFLRDVLQFVPTGDEERTPELRRAGAFLEHVERQVSGWSPKKRNAHTRRKLVFTLPASEGRGGPEQSALDGALAACRARGGAPESAWIASPFFDPSEETSYATAELCKKMARGKARAVCVCVPGSREGDDGVPRLAAPRSLAETPARYGTAMTIKLLPATDGDGNIRPWHAKMLALLAGPYTALMVGSSNFTCAGMGFSSRRNIEANLVTVVDRIAYGRDERQLEGIWPEMEQVADPDTAEWLGSQPEHDEEEQATALPLPAGFRAATYRAGDSRKLILHMDAAGLPPTWTVHAVGSSTIELLSSDTWRARGEPKVVEIAWASIYPPEKLHVRWGDAEAFLAINVEDTRELPPPAALEKMSADDMLLILAAADPSAAFRAWAVRQQDAAEFDAELDSATPIDLDPLRRYDLQTTFLHRIRRRARVLAQLRENLQRPVWGAQALEWRLRGMIGIEPLADRLLRQFAEATSATDEWLLTLADFLIVLREVNYQPEDGALARADFERQFRPFLREIADKMDTGIVTSGQPLSGEIRGFWQRVVERCRT